MVKIKQNTSVVDVALNLSGSITGLPAVVDQLPVGNRVGFLSGWTGETGPALNMYGDPQYLRNGVNTSNGFFMSEDPALLFEGSRTHEICFTTGEDVQTFSCLISTRNGDLIGWNVLLYISGGAVRACAGGGCMAKGPSVQPNTTYHVVLSVDADYTKADMYVNGGIAASISSFSYYQNPNVYLVGTLNYPNGSYPFKGVIHYHRLFNYALSAYDAALLWNNGDPMAYTLPPEVLNINLSHRYSFMSPMTLDEWTNVKGTDIPPVIEDGAIKCAFNGTAVESYKNGIFRTFDNFTEGKLLIVKCKMKSTVAGNTVSYGFATNGFNLYGAQGAVLSTEWKEYIRSVTNNYLKILNSIYFYGSYNTAQLGFYYIKDVVVIEAGCVAEYLSQGLVQPLPNIWRDVADIGQTWTPDLQGMELDLDVPVYDTLGKAKAPYSTDLFALQQAITDGEGYLKTLSNLIE